MFSSLPLLVLLVVSTVAAADSNATVTNAPVVTVANVTDAPVDTTTLATAIATEAVNDGPFTSHFLDFLKTDENATKYIVNIAHSKHSDAFGSFGGKATDEEKITQRPVIFIHGNSDYALHRPNKTVETGWTKSVQHFKKNGYTKAALYGLTYGTGDVADAGNNTITCDYVKTHRVFIESVLNYTQHIQVDIIAHSMGVTIARMALQGGSFKLGGQDCELGASLKGKVRTLVSIAGAHYGMCLCFMLSDALSCNKEDGFFAGNCNSTKTQTMENCMNIAAAEGDQIEYSHLLQYINKCGDGKEGKEAERIVTLYSHDDNVLGMNGNLAWGRQTSLYPGSDHVEKFLGFNHFQVKDETAAAQLKYVSGG